MYSTLWHHPGCSTGQHSQTPWLPPKQCGAPREHVHAPQQGASRPISQVDARRPVPHSEHGLSAAWLMAQCKDVFGHWCADCRRRLTRTFCPCLGSRAFIGVRSSSSLRSTPTLLLSGYCAPATMARRSDWPRRRLSCASPCPISILSESASGRPLLQAIKGATLSPSEPCGRGLPDAVPPAGSPRPVARRSDGARRL